MDYINYFGNVRVINLLLITSDRYYFKRVNHLN